MRFTIHCLERMLSRKLTSELIEQIVNEGQEISRSSEGYRRFMLYRNIVITNEEKTIAITTYKSIREIFNSPLPKHKLELSKKRVKKTHFEDY